MKVVIDTNVLVSALLNHGGLPAKILEMFLDGRFDAVVNEEIMKEYELVLNRKKFGFNPGDITDLLAYFRNYAAVAPSLPETAEGNMTHEDDRKFAEAATAAEADYLITGNLKHFIGIKISN